MILYAADLERKSENYKTEYIRDGKTVRNFEAINLTTELSYSSERNIEGII